ncbi:MAG TPA: hypothetical protein VM451_06350 [Candidatus Limnocylindria bacterium]|nr:hypothetical protein [Candidatus Limnocylindria bacterium]
MSPSRPERLAVGIASGDRKVFASALNWPGWARSGKTEEAAVEALLASAPRYAEAIRAAGLGLPEQLEVELVERSRGGSGVDFGVPGSAAVSDARSVDAAEATRLASIVEAAWVAFDRVRAGAPAELRKGPRGGGRDRDKMAAHVIESDWYYARELGLMDKAPAWDDTAAIHRSRQAVVAILREPSDGGPLAGRKWTQRYAAHRIAWHALDHAWEMQDRSE